eukprot:g17980.t1
MSDTGVGVKASFSVRGETVHQFSSSGATDSPPVAAAAAGIGEQGPVEGNDKYDYRYSGRHDHGTLPPLKTGGPHGELVKAILAAKADSDAFLTGLISQSQKSETDVNGADRASGGGGGKEGGEEAEPMELDGSGARGGAGAGADADAAASMPGQGGGALPPTPPSAQPAKRPRP